MHDGRLDTGRDKRSQRLPPPNSSYFASFRNHIDILLLAPWNAHLDKASGYSFESAKHVRIANPVSFLTQKLLIQKERDRRDRAKDTLYIHDTIEVFAGSLAELRELFAKEIRPSWA